MPLPPASNPEARVADAGSSAQAHYQRGNAQLSRRERQAAVESYTHAIALQPDHAAAHRKRGIALLGLRRFREALASCMKAVTLDTDSADNWVDLGRVFHQLQQHDLALGAYRKALAINPRYSFLPGRILQQKLLCCDWKDLDGLVAGIERDVLAGHASAPPFELMATSNSPRILQLGAEQFSKRRFPDLPDRRPGSRPFHNEKIRIGYVSGEFRSQATAFLLTGVLEHHDKGAFEVFAFDNGWDDRSATRERISRAVDHIIDIRELDDDRAAAVISGNEIDVLVNLNGYFGEERSAVFQRRPAPVQVNYLGFPGTMGAGYMDYIIADQTVLPASDKPFYSEKVAYLPNSYQANDRTKAIGERTFSRAETGLPEKGFVFCCFNANYKILPPMLDVWVRILDQVEGSVLWLLESNATASANLRREAAARGLNPARLIFAKPMPLSDHLARHRCADLFLDTLPCNAHTTASDALWSGLPVLTCLGEAFAGRVAASLLRAVGMPELVTANLDDYARLAVQLATDPKRIAAIRGKLADSRLTKPLFDTALYTRHLERAYAVMHERCQHGLPPDHFAVSA